MCHGTSQARQASLGVLLGDLGPRAARDEDEHTRGVQENENIVPLHVIYAPTDNVHSHDNTDQIQFFIREHFPRIPRSTPRPGGLTIVLRGNSIITKELPGLAYQNDKLQAQ